MDPADNGCNFDYKHCFIKINQKNVQTTYTGKDHLILVKYWLNLTNV